MNEREIAERREVLARRDDRMARWRPILRERAERRAAEDAAREPVRQARRERRRAQAEARRRERERAEAAVLLVAARRKAAR